MKKFTYFLYVNGVYCMDKAVEAHDQNEALKILKATEWFEQFRLVKEEPIA